MPIGDPAYAPARPTIAIPAARAHPARLDVRAAPVASPTSCRSGSAGSSARSRRWASRRRRAATSRRWRRWSGRRPARPCARLDRPHDRRDRRRDALRRHEDRLGQRGHAVHRAESRADHAVGERVQDQCRRHQRDRAHASGVRRCRRCTWVRPPTSAGPRRPPSGCWTRWPCCRARRTCPTEGVVYPTHSLGTALRDTAQLIKANVGLRAVAVDYGDWDMHVGQGTVDTGWMIAPPAGARLGARGFRERPRRRTSAA